MSRLCQYKSVFGEPGKGVHSLRIFGFALVDVLLTIIVAFAIAHYFNKNVIVVFIVLLAIAVFLHWLFCVDTALNKMVGLA